MATDYLGRDEAPFGEETFAALDEIVVSVAKAQLSARRLLEIEGPFGFALKSVPLGQTDGQRLLLRLGALLPGIVDAACALGDDDLCNYTPGFAILCSRHETQYSRLFRS